MLCRPSRALLCGVAAAALAGCTSSGPAQTPPEQLAAPAPARATLADVKSAQEAQQKELERLAAEYKAQDAQQSFLLTELKSLSEQIAKLKSSLEDVESSVRSMRATPVPPESRPALAPAPPPPSAPVIAPAPPPAPAPAVSAAPPPAAPSRNVEADRTFAVALARLRSGDDGQAALEFTEFVAQFPSHPQAAAAQNYIGEAFYRQRDFKQAAIEYQKTVDNYTQSAQVSEALLKIGLSQRALGDAERARAVWEQLVKQFPRSDAARQARALLAARTGNPR